MCGIAGLVSRGRFNPGLLKAMGDRIRHRGPDDHGEWVHAATGVGFAHRRLAIIDLGPHGHQPMASADGRWTICFNGEIYNHRALRSMLDAEGRTPPGGWRGHSDTETLVEAVSAWGVDTAIDRCVGMFALALHDAAERTLALVRDRFGEKPLYYGWCGSDFVFASELKAVRAHPDFDASIEPRALPGYLATGTVGGAWSVHRGLFKLPPGCRLDIDLSQGPPSRSTDPLVPGHRAERMRMKRYWDYRQTVIDGLANPFGDEGEAIEALDAGLRDAIRDQAVADVPVGAFLSGGIDSSTIVAFYQAVANRQVRTYTIGFDRPEYDESGHARAVAEHLGTEHHEFRVTLDEARDVIPLLPSIYDEPFADSSQIPTFIVSRLARRDVTVALTGDGGDELFGGYHRHILAPRIWRQVGKFPRPLRQLAFGTAAALPGPLLSAAGSLAGLSREARKVDKLRKFARVAGRSTSFDHVADSFVDEWYGEASPLPDEWRTIGEDRGLPANASSLTQIMYRDAIAYLPDDILTKVDRASMAVSLETRVPFLDHRVAALAARLPSSLQVDGGRGKIAIRRLLGRHVPEVLFERPKAGFGIPVGEWLRGPLRDWAEALLDPAKLREEGLFASDPIRRRWNAHIEGRRDSTVALWSILMFESWRQSQEG